ncbi:MAG: ribosomal protein S18-alanine N-acetyltransferase [Acidaminobacteraceae bacterium]
MGYIFRKMLASDIEAVYIIESRSFPTPWSIESFYKEINENRLAHYYVVENLGEVIAYGGMWVIIDESHITNIAVLPEYRGHGVGNILVSGMVDFAKTMDVFNMTLEVRVTNESAIKLYEKHGFERSGVRPNYYRENNEDALIMWKKL